MDHMKNVVLLLTMGSMIFCGINSEASTRDVTHADNKGSGTSLGSSRPASSNRKVQSTPVKAPQVVPPKISYSASLAILGYDPVAYFTMGKSVKGNQNYQHKWESKTWYFSTEANRDNFIKDPVKYAPQYKGLCAFAVSQGGIAIGDPEVWTVFENKLYFNISPIIKKRWESEKEVLIHKADTHWPKIKYKAL